MFLATIASNSQLFARQGRRREWNSCFDWISMPPCHTRSLRSHKALFFPLTICSACLHSSVRPFFDSLVVLVLALLLPGFGVLVLSFWPWLLWFIEPVFSPGIHSANWEANNPLAPLGMSWIPPAAAADVLRLFLLRRYGGVKSIAWERERERMGKR